MRIAQVSKTSETTPALAPYLIILAQYNSLFSLDGGGSKDAYTRSGTYTMCIHFWGRDYCKLKSNSWVLSGLQLSWNFL